MSSGQSIAELQKTWTLLADYIKHMSILVFQISMVQCICLMQRYEHISEYYQRFCISLFWVLPNFSIENKHKSQYNMRYGFTLSILEQAKHWKLFQIMIMLRFPTFSLSFCLYPSILLILQSTSIVSIEMKYWPTYMVVGISAATFWHRWDACDLTLQSPQLCILSSQNFNSLLEIFLYGLLAVPRSLLWMNY